MTNHEDACLFCHRCGAVLRPGSGDFYVVKIEAVADPWPPEITREQLEQCDPSSEIARLIDYCQK